MSNVTGFRARSRLQQEDEVQRRVEQWRARRRAWEREDRIYRTIVWAACMAAVVGMLWSLVGPALRGLWRW